MWFGQQNHFAIIIALTFKTKRSKKTEHQSNCYQLPHPTCLQVVPSLLRHMSFVPKNQTCIWLCSVPYGMSAIGWSMSLSDKPCPCFNFPCFTALYEIIARMMWLITNAFQTDAKLTFLYQTNLYECWLWISLAYLFQQHMVYLDLFVMYNYGGFCIHTSSLLCSS